MAGLFNQASGPPAMLQDIELGRPTEVEAVFGQIQEFARDAGVVTPALDTAVALLRGVDQSIRIKAAELETSVSALVKKYLSDLAAEESEFEQLKRMEQALRDRIVTFRASDRLSRDEVHERGR